MKICKTQDKTLACMLATDCVEFLKGESVGLWGSWFPKFVEGLHDKDEGLRTACIYILLRGCVIKTRGCGRHVYFAFWKFVEGLRTACIGVF